MMNGKCQWCGMDPETGKSYLNWKCGSRQNSKGTRTQSDACAEIVELQDKIKRLERDLFDLEEYCLE